MLRPGGRHIFTVPVVWTRTTTESRARIGDDGEIVHLMPALYHGRGSGAYRFIPVGADLLTSPSSAATSSITCARRASSLKSTRAPTTAQARRPYSRGESRVTAFPNVEMMRYSGICL